jgi:hypothetical protein
VEYALNTPGINNPAGCVVELIRRNETRKPAAHIQQQAQESRTSLDPEKYTSGKYAFLFRPRGAESAVMDQEDRAQQVEGRGEPEIGGEIDEVAGDVKGLGDEGDKL